MRVRYERYGDVWLDRDEFINQRMPGGYVTSWDQFEFLSRAGGAAAAARDLDTMIQKFCWRPRFREKTSTGCSTVLTLLSRNASAGSRGRGCSGSRKWNVCWVPETPFFESDSPKDRGALDAVGCRMMLIRRTSFLKTTCLRNWSDSVVSNQYEAGGTGLTAEMTKAGQAVMDIVRA
jgi:hypothetical protein